MPRAITATRACALLLILLTALAAPARALTLDGIRLHAGGALARGDVDGGGITLTLTPDTTPAWLAFPGEDFHWEFSATTWPDAGADGGSVQTAHFGPVWHYEPAILPARGFIELGTSIARVSDRRLEDRDLGSHTHFTTHVSFGWRPRPAADWHVGLRVRHTSNAGRGDPNPGLDIVMFELGMVP